MPVRDGARTLATAIRSILAQTYPHWELLLIDDGSSDETVQVARAFADPRITLVSDGAGGLGLAARLNQAIDLSAGEYFARMDGDDVAYPERLERQVAYLRAHPEVDLVGAGMLIFGADGIVLGKRANAEHHEAICARPDYGITLPHPTWMGRIAFFRRFRYRLDAVRCEDADLLLRAYRDARFASVPEILLGYREERLSLGKILTYRRLHVRSIVREFRHQGKPHLAARGVATQVLKAAVDCVAVTSGLGYRLLRHRARPVTDVERRRWHDVWAGLNAAQSTSAAIVGASAVRRESFCGANDACAVASATAITLVHVAPHPMFFSFLKGQISFMKARGLELHAVASPGPLLDALAAREGISVHAVTVARRIAPLRDLVSIVRLYRELRVIRPHIVHSHTPKGGLVGMTAAWLARVPVRIAHSDGLPILTARGHTWALLWCSEKMISLLAHRVLYVSHSNRHIAVQRGLCPVEKTGVILNGSVNGVEATEQFNPARVRGARDSMRQTSGIPGDALVVGFVGRLLREKGVAELVAAWGMLRAEFPALHLLIVGTFDSRDPVSPEVEALLRDDPRIHLTGQVEDMPPLYAAMDIVALPSYREGLGMVLLEASAMALPTVATDVPGCIDAVQDGVTGTLVPARDAGALADALRRYLRSPELRTCHGGAGRERVLRDFRPGALWEAQYLEYVRLLGAKVMAIVP